MKRDILFFAKNLPKEYLIQGEDVFMVVAGDFFPDVQKACASIPDLKPFLEGLSGESLVLCGIFNEFESESEAIAEAWRRLSVFLDAYPFLTQEVRTELSNVVCVREESSPDVLPRVFLEFGFVAWQPKEAGGLEAKALRDRKVGECLVKYLSYAASKDPQPQTGLLEQLQMSLKMFRLGASARLPTVEFLCKFFALEGMVCGSSYDDGRTTIWKKRIAELFSRSFPGAGDAAKRLMQCRSAAAHHARMSDSELWGNVDLLNQLMLGMFFFAVEHIEKANSIEQLWSHAATYDMPSIVFARFGDGRAKLTFKDCVIKQSLTWFNVGKIIETLYHRPQSSQEIKNP